MKPPSTIAALRGAAQLSGYECARIMGVSEPTYRRIEKGRRPATADEYRELGPHVALGIKSPDELLPKYLIAIALPDRAGTFKPLLDEAGKIGVFMDGGLAHETSLALGNITLPGVFACPAWNGWTIQLIEENAGRANYYLVDEDIGESYTHQHRALAKRVRAMEYAASVMRRVLVQACGAELAAIGKPA